MLVSPTEPPRFHDLGSLSSRPEKYGCDFLVTAGKTMIGIQRKQFPGDFLASLADGRLYEQLHRMGNLDHVLFVLEGRGKWTTDGELIHSDFAQFHVSQLNGILFTLAFEFGVPSITTRDVNETHRVLVDLDHWAHKEKHMSLKRRPGPPKDSWGRVTNKSYGIHILQSFPGTGPDLAARILEHFGKVPLRWEVDEDELMEVPGIGKVRAARLIQALAELEIDNDS